MHIDKLRKIRHAVHQYEMVTYACGEMSMAFMAMLRMTAKVKGVTEGTKVIVEGLRHSTDSAMKANYVKPGTKLHRLKMDARWEMDLPEFDEFIREELERMVMREENTEEENAVAAEYERDKARMN